MRFTDVAGEVGLLLHVEQRLHRRPQVLPAADVRRASPSSTTTATASSTSSSRTAGSCPTTRAPTRPSTAACCAGTGDGTFEEVDGEGERRRQEPRHLVRRRRRRLRQRRAPRPVRRERGPERPLPQQRRRHVHRRDGGLGPRRQAEGPAVGLRRVLRLRQRRAPRPRRLALHVLEPAGRQALPDARRARSTATPGTYKSVPHSLYHNLGNGKFEDVTAKSGFDAVAGKGMGIGIADFNGDGFMDVFVANDTEPNFLYMNQGNGTFKEESWAWGIAYDEQGAVVSGMGADARDFNDDGWPDVFYNNLQAQIWALFQNEGGTHFRYVSPRSGIARLSRRFSGWSQRHLRLRQRRLEGHLLGERRRRLPRPNSAQHDTMFHNVDGKVFADVSEGLGPDFVREGLPARLGVRRPQRRRLPRPRRDLAQQAAAHPAQLRRQREPLAVARPRREEEQPRRDRREGEGHDRERPRPPQPRLGERRLHVLERPAAPLRPRRRLAACDRSRSAGRAARPRASTTSRSTRCCGSRSPP